MTAQKYTLKEARQVHGLSRQDLSVLSGIAALTIYNIEKEGVSKTHDGVAMALADALGLEVWEINWPRGLTHLGRPPKTGKPLTVRRTVTVTISEEVQITASGVPICARHFIALPATGICDDCSS